jgi:dissimilatory sulfite reductase (desulfoviridin) alpha/beta subunit
MSSPSPRTLRLDGPGFRVTACRGAQDCPRRVLDAPGLPRALAAALEALAPGAAPAPAHAHTLLRVAVAYCPNACSQPQIADVGAIGAATPAADPAACVACGACAAACRESAVDLDGLGAIRGIDATRCLGCGACAAACPAQVIATARRGFRVLAGGKLGRHPRLADELPGLCAPEALPARASAILAACLAARHGHERPGDVVARLGAAALAGDARAPGRD